MTSGWISADRLFDGSILRSNYAVQIESDRIIALSPTADLKKEDIIQHHVGLLTPGFFDIQVNGGGGALLNTDPSVGAIDTIAKAHRSKGTVAFLPTVITDKTSVLEAAADAILQAKDVPGVMGLHIEGPHLSKARRGTHDASYIRPLDAKTFSLVRELRDTDATVLITVAPESATQNQIAQLSEMGAVVSIGHTDASATDAANAVAAGATCFTHLFNAMSPMQNRAPGVTGAAIASDVWCSIIADGIHVDPMMVILAIRARPKLDRMILVSDAMATVGGPDAFMLYGQEIHLDDGRLVNAEGSLAGAHLTMLDALRNLVSYGVDLQAALRMCRQNPAQLLGIWDKLGLIGMDAADLLVLDDDLSLKQVGVALTPKASKQA